MTNNLDRIPQPYWLIIVILGLVVTDIFVTEIIFYEGWFEPIVERFYESEKMQ